MANAPRGLPASGNDSEQMNSPFLNHRALVLLVLMAVVIAAMLAPHSLAGTQEQRLPNRAGHINDFAGVLDTATRERLESILEKLQDKTKLDFVVATIKSAGKEDLYDYSLAVANDWKVGAPAGTDRSLLIVIAADSGKFFSQVTRAARIYLPEGVVGQMGQRIRDRVSDGFNGALLAGVRTFVDRVGELHNFDFASLDPQRGETIAQAQRPRTVQSPAIERGENPSPAATVTTSPESPTPAVTATPVETRTPEPRPSPSPTAETTPTPEPSATATPTAQPTETPSSTPSATPAESPSPQTAEPSPSANVTPEPSIETKPSPAKTPSPDRKATASTSSPDDEIEQVELTLTLPAEKRIDVLKQFIATHPKSVALPRANEYLVVAHSMFAGQRLETGDVDTALQQFRLAVSDAPADLPDRLFSDVLGRIPLNLFLHNQRDAAYELAHQIEPLTKSNAKRIIALAEFYLAIENAPEAARLAESAVQVSPDLATAHRALAAARHIDLRLDDAESEYAKALALDPKLAPARIGLADMKRANGKFDEALALYREQLQADPKNNPARTGEVLSLLELGKKDEAETELNAVLQDKDLARNLPLMAGAAYWFQAHNNTDRAKDLLQRAIALEPRYSWGQIALARALVANKQPLQAERGLRFARQYSRFPTMDYELASVLAAVGLYDEAVQELTRSFSIKDGEIQTKLAGRIAAHAASFTELLAPERRAAIFQTTPADAEANAKMLKALLAFNAAIEQSSPNENEVIAAAQEFVKGDDAMRTYRQVYAAGRLVKKQIALLTALELMDQAPTGVEAALNVPNATVAVQPEELANARASALAQGGMLDVPDAPRAALSGLLRGRIEDLAGLALFNLDKHSEAVVRLRRAVATATEGTPLLRSAMWHLAAALEANGKNDQALLYYIKSYVNGPPDQARRSVIESVYKKVNGTLDGLEDKIGPGFNAATANPSPTPSP
jgi:tetratricopeptide (TPR) repeat protein